METPLEDSTPADPSPCVPALNAILSSGTTEASGVRSLVQTSLNINGQYTPPASQSTPPIQSHIPPESVRVSGSVVREMTPPVREPSPLTPSSHDGHRMTSSSPTSAASSKTSSASKSLGRSSLRQLLTSTTPRALDVNIEGVQKGLEALSLRNSHVKVPN